MFALNGWLGIALACTFGSVLLCCLIFAVLIILKKFGNKTLSSLGVVNKDLNRSFLNSSSLRGNLIRTYKTVSIDDDYILDMTQEIGKGGCGVVISGECRNTQAQYAIKVVTKGVVDLSRLERELKLLKNVDHTNIVRLFSAYDTFSKVYFVMEMCHGGHLGNLISRNLPHLFLPEEWAKRLCRQLVSAVAHIHGRGIAHRDIKLQNVLIDISGDDRNAQIKLIDFGYGSCFIGALPMKTKCGTPYTTAPEVFRECYDERCDVWSIGVVLYIMLCGKRPFESMDFMVSKEVGKGAMVMNILAGRYHMKHKPWLSVSAKGKAFVKALLHPNYKQRMTSAEALEHPWLNDGAMQKNNTKILETHQSVKAISNMQSMLTRETNSLQKVGSVAMIFGHGNKTAGNMREMFQAIDKDGNGSLSLDEFLNAMALMQPDLTEEDAERIFEIVDIDENNQLSYTEFLVASVDPCDVDIEELYKTFSLIDMDRNGGITREELKQVLQVKRKTRLQRQCSIKLGSRSQAGVLSLQSSSDDGITDRLIGGSGQHAVNKPSSNWAMLTGSGKVQMGSGKMRGSGKVAPIFDKGSKQSAPFMNRMNENSPYDSDQDSHEVDILTEQIFEEYDMDNDGAISYKEFLWAMTGLEMYKYPDEEEMTREDLEDVDEDTEAAKVEQSRQYFEEALLHDHCIYDEESEGSLKEYKQGPDLELDLGSSHISASDSRNHSWENHGNENYSREKKATKPAIQWQSASPKEERDIAAGGMDNNNTAGAPKSTVKGVFNNALQSPLQKSFKYNPSDSEQWASAKRQIDAGLILEGGGSNAFGPGKLYTTPESSVSIFETDGDDSNHDDSNSVSNNNNHHRYNNNNPRPPRFGSITNNDIYNTGRRESPPHRDYSNYSQGSNNKCLQDHRVIEVSDTSGYSEYDCDNLSIPGKGSNDVLCLTTVAPSRIYNSRNVHEVDDDSMSRISTSLEEGSSKIMQMLWKKGGGERRSFSDDASPSPPLGNGTKSAEYSRQSSSRSQRSMLLS